MKLITLLAAAICMNLTVCLAQDSVTIKKTQTDTVTQKPDATTADPKAIKDTQTKMGQVTVEPGSPAFGAWEDATKNPCTLYNGKCGDCTVDPKLCKDSPLVIKIITWILLAIIFFLSLRYLFKSGLCKDESYVAGPNGLTLRLADKRPFSYARIQLFWWTLIIFNCYGVFFALYGTLLPLNPTAVLLLGAGLATQLLGKTIDNNQIDNTKPANVAGAVLDPIRHQDLAASKNLLTDILSDENGISIHRLQSVMFNIIYGIGFISYFIKSVSCCAYPLITFEGWQLTLLGISTAGYLGMKTTENSTSTEAARKAEATSASNTAAGTVPAGSETQLRDQAKYQ